MDCSIRAVSPEADGPPGYHAGRASDGASRVPREGNGHNAGFIGILPGALRVHARATRRTGPT